MGEVKLPRLMAYSDGEVEKALYGNPKDLESFLKKVTRDISRNLSKSTFDYVAEELALDVVEKMCRHRRDTKFRDHPGNYTRRIIFGTIVDHLRSALAKKRLFYEQCSGPVDDEEPIFGFQFSGRRQWISIEELDLLSEETMDLMHGVGLHDLEVEQEELISILNSIFDGLGDYGKALRYRSDELSYAEIAELMGKKVNTIKSLLNRGRILLDIELIKAGYTEHDLGVTRKKDNGKVKKK